MHGQQGWIGLRSIEAARFVETGGFGLGRGGRGGGRRGGGSGVVAVVNAGTTTHVGWEGVGNSFLFLMEKKLLFDLTMTIQSGEAIYLLAHGSAFSFIVSTAPPDPDHHPPSRIFRPRSTS